LHQLFGTGTNPALHACVDFAYDNLDKLTLAQYSIDQIKEVFTIDDLVMLGRRVRELRIGRPPKKRTKKLRW